MDGDLERRGAGFEGRKGADNRDYSDLILTKGLFCEAAAGRLRHNYTGHAAVIDRPA
jgi:hypothetical protein